MHILHIHLYNTQHPYIATRKFNTRHFYIILILSSSFQIYAEPTLESKGVHIFFQKKGKKDKIFENFDKNIKKLKFF